MPPLDWSIVKSALLFLILPSFTVACAVTAISFALTRSEPRRSVSALVAMIATLAIGNWLNNLVPFWTLDTGWRSLFCVAVLAATVEIAIVCLRLRFSSEAPYLVIGPLICFACAIWATPAHFKWRPIAIGLLYVAIVLNGTGLQSVSERKFGRYVPLAISVAWLGSSAFLLILSHSARFADLAVLFSCTLAGIGVVTAFAGQSLNNLYAAPAVFVPGLMFSAALDTYSAIPYASFVLLAIAPVLLNGLRSKRLGDWFDRHPIALLLAGSIPSLIAVGLAIRAEMFSTGVS